MQRSRALGIKVDKSIFVFLERIPIQLLIEYIHFLKLLTNFDETYTKWSVILFELVNEYFKFKYFEREKFTHWWW